MDNATDYLDIAVYWPSGQQKYTNNELETWHLQEFIHHRDRSVAQILRKRKFTLLNGEDYDI